MLYNATDQALALLIAFVLGLTSRGIARAAAAAVRAWTRQLWARFREAALAVLFPGSMGHNEVIVTREQIEALRECMLRAQQARDMRDVIGYMAEARVVMDELELPW